jgi:ankyrin repeat protein
LAASGSGADSGELARVLIDARADVNLQTLPGKYPITVAKCREVARVLLEAKADCNKEVRRGATALSRAFTAENPHLMALLLAHKADTGAAIVGPVLTAAVTAGQVAVVELLLRGASPAALNFRDADGMVALHFAVKQNRMEM